MVRPNPIKQTKRGPPATGINAIMAFRPLPPLRAAVEAYAKVNAISISEGMRRLIELGLKRSALTVRKQG